MPQESKSSQLPVIPRLARARPDSAEKCQRDSDTALALDLLASGGCPACGFAESREGKFFLWFALEHHLEHETIEQLDAALGMCPRHCRALMRLRVYPGTLTGIYVHVVRAALRRLAEPGEDGACIACAHEQWASQHAIDLVGKTLAKESVSAAYRERGGFCATHFLNALARGTRERADFLLDVFMDRLTEGASSPDVVSMFAGRNPDSEVRATLLQGLPDDALDAEEHNVTTRECLATFLRVGSCPACLAAGQARRRYLRWIGIERERGREYFGREIVGLCAAHLTDLARLDSVSAAWLAHETTSLWRGILARFRKQSLSDKPRNLVARLLVPSSTRQRDEARRRRVWILAQFLRETLAPRRHWAREVRSLAIQLPRCGACAAEKTAAKRMNALLLAGVEDASLLPLYEGSHGLCVRHVLALPEADRVVPLRVCRARLDWLAWELDEADRKQSWLIRYEKRGDESSAWRRAMAQIDGHVFLGGPAIAVG